jgi:hypothetical protein
MMLVTLFPGFSIIHCLNTGKYSEPNFSDSLFRLWATRKLELLSARRNAGVQRQIQAEGEGCAGGELGHQANSKDGDRPSWTVAPSPAQASPAH